VSQAPTGRRGARDTHVPARDDLPGYVLRISNRARHVRLTVTPKEGLVVVVPAAARGFDPARVLRQKALWIEQALAESAKMREALSRPAEALLPSDIGFAATGERLSPADFLGPRINARGANDSLERPHRRRRSVPRRPQPVAAVESERAFAADARERSSDRRLALPASEHPRPAESLGWMLGERRDHAQSLFGLPAPGLGACGDPPRTCASAPTEPLGRVLARAPCARPRRGPSPCADPNRVE
jgi:hypothetical protein